MVFKKKTPRKILAMTLGTVYLVYGVFLLTGL
jgi:hypothetical protein